MGVTLGVVVLTMGDRNPDLLALVESVSAQDGELAKVVVLGQGAGLPELPAAVTGVELPENVGIPAGRNAGVRWLREHGGIDVVVVLDDDGLLPRTDTFELIRGSFIENPRLGVVSFRIVDEDGLTQRRHVPRLGSSDPTRSGEVTTFLGGGHAIRMSVIDEVGEFPGPFFYAHEETDFAWRALTRIGRSTTGRICSCVTPVPNPPATVPTTGTRAGTECGWPNAICRLS